MATKNMLLTGMIEGILYDIMPKTTGGQVYLNDTTTVAAKIAEMVEAINLRAKTTDVTSLINELRQEMLGETPVEAYNTFTELAQYIAEHKEVSDALTAAIGNKADATAVGNIQVALAGLGQLSTKNVVTESELDTELQNKINGSSGATHTHSNGAALNMITEDKIANWNEAFAQRHEHDNKSVLDHITTDRMQQWDVAYTNQHNHPSPGLLNSITGDDVASWRAAASRPTVYVGGTTQPEGMTNGDLWFKEME